MQPYDTNSLYATSAVIDIADSAFAAQALPPVASRFAIHNTEPLSTDVIYKKRKVERACDACRRRKTKCDGPHMPDNVCTNCIQNRKTCTYVEASKPRGPPKAYITSLEDRLEKMEALLKRHPFLCGSFIHSGKTKFPPDQRCHGPSCTCLRPEVDFSEELGPPVIRDSWKTDPEPPRRVSPHEKSTSPVSFSRPKGSPSGCSRSHALPASRSAGTPRSDTDLSSDGYTSTESEEVGELSLLRGMKRLTIRGLEPTQDHRLLADNQIRFHGKSSCFKLIEPTRKLRDEHVNRVTGGEELRSSSRDRTSPFNAAASWRPECWTTPPWEMAFESFEDRLEDLLLSLAENLPPQDLADSLISLFFENVNPFFPLFHRPTFERQWKDGLQHKDALFGCLCLSVFAVASRWSDDSRVLDDGKYDVPQAERPVGKYKWQRAGWRYFNTAVDVHRGSVSLLHPAGLFEVQTMALLGMFLRGTAFHPVAWLFVGIGLRKAQDVGAHRKKIYGDKPTTEGELWKRAFWVLVLLDRVASASLGRPCCSGEEEFDAEFPLEVDDEYWEPEGQKAFQQPPGKPSKIAAFNSHLKLTKIVAYAMRTIYVLDRSKLMFSAARPRWQEVLAQLNQAMIEWVDSVPQHLQWSPHIEDPLFSDQSATLYITYYLIQIIIYRPFSPPSLHSATNITPHSNMPIPSIAICINAGKCISRILKSQITRGYLNTPTLILGSHICAAILLMNFWDLKWQERNQMKYDGLEDSKSPLALAMAELLAEVSVFIKALEAVKFRWRSAEMYLNDLSSSLPHSLGGYEPDNSKNDPVSCQHLPKVDDGTHCNATPQDYAILMDYRDVPPEYRIAPSPPTSTTSPNTQVELLERRPHFEFPHITRYPVPGILPLTSSASYGRDQSKSGLITTFQSQRGDNRFWTHTELGDQRSSMSNIHSYLIDERAVDEIRMGQQDSSVCRQHATTGQRSYGSVSVSMQPSVASNFGPHQRIPSWNYNPSRVSGISSEGATVQPDYLWQDTVASSHSEALSFSRRY